MGKSKATERIERVMTKLSMEGKLDKPFFPKEQRTPQSKVAHKRREKKQPTGCYCRDKYEKLPDGFVSCLGCPLDNSAQME